MSTFIDLHLLLPKYNPVWGLSWKLSQKMNSLLAIEWIHFNEFISFPELVELN